MRSLFACALALGSFVVPTTSIAVETAAAESAAAEGSAQAQGWTKVQSWAQFRGPDGQGHARATGLPQAWSESSGLVWKSALPGLGHSSPVFVDRHVWMTTAQDEGKSLRAICVDAESGKLLHNIEVFKPAEPPHVNAKNSFASPTPVLEGDRLYVHFGTVGTACLDTKSAKVVWTSADLHWDHQEGPGSSPILHGDKLIFHADGRDSQSIVALDKQTGKVAWNVKRSGAMSDTPDFRKAFSTPLVVDVEGKPELISPCADRVIAYDPISGKELWKVTYKGFSNVPRPVAGNGLVYVCTGYMKPQLWAIKPGGSGDVTSSAAVWKVTKQVPANSSPILLGEDLYMVSDQGILSCVDALKGDVRWTERLGGNFSASPVVADGKLYFCSEDGATSVLQPGEKFNLLVSNKLDGRIMASPVVYGQHLLIRTGTHLYKIGQPEVTRTASAE